MNSFAPIDMPVLRSGAKMPAGDPAPFQVRRAAGRLHVNEGWRDTCHTFHPPGDLASALRPSGLADKVTSVRDRFHSLLGIQDELLMPGMPALSHRLEGVDLLTLVLAGSLEVAADPSGIEGVRLLHPGDFQAISAGTALTHRRGNPSLTEASHVLHLWMEPGVPPTLPAEAIHTERLFPHAQMELIASGGSLTPAAPLRLGLPARVWHSRLRTGEHLRHQLTDGHHAWLHIAEGDILLESQHLSCGDGASVPAGAPPFRLKALRPSRLLLIEV